MRKNEHLSIPRIGYVIATLKVGSERKKVRFLYREVVNSDKDSGWRIFSGEEDQNYCDKPSNMAIYDPGTIAEIDPDIIPLLAYPAPCAFERDDISSPFRLSEGHERPSEE